MGDFALRDADLRFQLPVFPIQTQDNQRAAGDGR